MKISILKSCAGVNFAYYTGETVDAETSIAKDLIDAGYAEEIKPTKAKAGVKANADT